MHFVTFYRMQAKEEIQVTRINFRCVTQFSNLDETFKVRKTLKTLWLYFHYEMKTSPDYN